MLGRTKNWNSVYEAQQQAQQVDFGDPSPKCSCLSSFDGEGDGKCPVHIQEADDE